MDKYKKLDVPLMWQGYRNYCGPASLSMIFKYYGIDISQERIADSLGMNSSSSGASIDDLIGYVKSLDVFSCSLREGIYLDYVFDLIEKEKPVFVRAWDSDEKIGGHYRVIVGYDNYGHTILINDPGVKDYLVEIGKKQFLKLWDMRDCEWRSTDNAILDIRLKAKRRKLEM